MTALYPLLFEDNLYEMVWGGHKLMPLKGLKEDATPIGESWEVSDMPQRQSIVKNGALKGKKIGDLVKTYGAELLGERNLKKTGERLPLLVKFIDAAKSLSIQVHPNNRLALQRHGKLGKDEMWYVMEAEPGATLYAGFKQEITKEEYEQRVEDGTIVDVLAQHEVKPGDVFFIPAGRVHAINGGIMVCEIQQSSDLTYRIFDYNRPGLDGNPRELHTQWALDAIIYNVSDNYHTLYEEKQEGAVSLVDNENFAVNLISTAGKLVRNMQKEDSFVILTCIEGEAFVRVRSLNGEKVKGLKGEKVRRGYSCLIPASLADYEIESVDGSEVRMMESWAR